MRQAMIVHSVVSSFSVKRKRFSRFRGALPAVWLSAAPPKALLMHAFHEAGSLKSLDWSVVMQINRYIFQHYCNRERSHSHLYFYFSLSLHSWAVSFSMQIVGFPSWVTSVWLTCSLHRDRCWPNNRNRCITYSSRLQMCYFPPFR